jgi:hypothetical protein
MFLAWQSPSDSRVAPRLGVTPILHGEAALRLPAKAGFVGHLNWHQMADDRKALVKKMVDFHKPLSK